MEYSRKIFPEKEDFFLSFLCQKRNKKILPLSALPYTTPAYPCPTPALLTLPYPTCLLNSVDLRGDLLTQSCGKERIWLFFFLFFFFFFFVGEIPSFFPFFFSSNFFQKKIFKRKSQDSPIIHHYPLSIIHHCLQWKRGKNMKAPGRFHSRSWICQNPRFFLLDFLRDFLLLSLYFPLYFLLYFPLHFLLYFSPNLSRFFLSVSSFHTWMQIECLVLLTWGRFVRVSWPRSLPFCC